MVLIVIVATVLLFGTWELLGLPEQTLPFVAGGVAVGVGLLIRFLTRKRP